MADVSKIKLPNGTTYDIKDTISGYTTNIGTITKVQTTAGAHTTINVSSGAATFNVPTKTSHLTNDSGFITNAGVTGVKGNAESSYRTGQVNLTAANIGAIPANSNGNTQNLYRPLQLNGCNDNTLDSKINTLRANRLAFLPADQIIIEKTIDGGATWTDAGIADSTKVGLFSETRAGISIPLIDGSQNINCGLRITFTAMKYNVPANTAETNKYNYWNSEYIVSTERYNQLKEMYFWVSTSNNSMSIKVERATGANSTSWSTIYDSSSNNYGLTGWSGNDYIRFTQGVFGGGTTQTGNFWNYRLTFFTRGTNGSTTLNTGYLTSPQSIMEIRGYGDTWWTKGNEYAANDKIFTHDYLQNVTFPANVTATQFNGNLQATTINGVTVGSSPKFTDTDEKVYQSYKPASGYTYWRPLLAGYSSGSAETFTPSDATNLVYTFNTLKVQPSTGTIRVGNLALYNGSYTVTLTPDTLSASRTITVPNKTGTMALTSDIPTIPDTTGSATTGVSIADHSTTSIYGVSSSTTSVTGVSGSTSVYGVKSGTNSTTTASKASGANGTAPTLGTAISIYGVKSGTNSTTTASHVKSGGNGTAPTLGTAISLIGVQSSTTSVRGVKTGTNSTTTASKVTFGTAFSVPNPSFSDVTVPIRADADVTVPVAASSATTVPIKATSATTVPIKNTSATTIPNVTSVGTASSWTFESKTVVTDITFAMDTTDTKKLVITKSTDTVYSKSGGSNGTAPTLGTDISIIGVQSSTTSVTGVQSSTTSVTGVSGSTTVRGVKTGTSSTTTASKASLGTAFSIPNPSASDVTVPIRADADTTVPIKNANATSIPNVTSAGSASNWVFEDVTVPIRADSATSIPNVTSVGSASTWSFTDVTVPIRADSATTVPTAASSATTVPIKNGTATTVITSKTHSVTDNGHTHTI